MEFVRRIVFVALALLLAPVVALASVVTINYQIKDAASSTMASGFFSFDSALDGAVLSYADLSAFQFNFSGSGASFDLAFVNSGGWQAPYHNFEFDTSIDSFVFPSSSGADSPLTAIKAGYVDGFWVGDNNSIGDYSSGVPVEIGTFASVTTQRSTVPEPSTLALLGLSFAGLAASRRRKH